MDRKRSARRTEREMWQNRRHNRKQVVILEKVAQNMKNQHCTGGAAIRGHKYRRDARPFGGLEPLGGSIGCVH